MSNEQEYNSGHDIELLDRIHTIQTLLDSLLLDYIAAKKYGINNKLYQISDDLAQIYHDASERMPWDDN